MTFRFGFCCTTIRSNMTTKTKRRGQRAPAKVGAPSEDEVMACEVCGREYRVADPGYCAPCAECGVLACVDCWFTTFDHQCPNCDGKREEYRENRQYPKKDIFQDA